MDSTAGLRRSRRSSDRSQHNKANGIRPTRSPHLLLLNRQVFTEFMAERHKTTVAEIAAYLELGHGTVFEALRGRPVSAAFVSALLQVLGGSQKRLSEFFAPARNERVA